MTDQCVINRYQGVISMLVIGFLCMTGTVFGLTEEKQKPSRYPPWRMSPAETSPDSQKPWTPAVPVPQLPPGERPEIPAGKVWTPGELIDFALRHNPATKAAWFSARAAAAALASRGGDYLPQVTMTGTANGSYGSTSSRSEDWVGAIGPTLSASYLLYDAGGREASLDEARQALLAANFVHRSVLEDVMLQVLESYYILQGTRVLLVAEESAVKEAEAVLEAANERHRTGVATIADVLQAQASLAQTRLSLHEITRDQRIREGVLATEIGLPANSPLRLTEFKTDFPVDPAARDVDKLIAEACRLRPDLAAAAADVRYYEAGIRRVKSEGKFSISAGSAVGAHYNSRWDTFLDGYSVGLTFRWPVFTGYSHTFNVKRAREEAAASRERYEGLVQSAMLEVWRSYHTLTTSSQKIQTTDELLASATQSYDVALGRYRAGVGNILDLLATQRTLEEARAQYIRARTEWLVALAYLARDTGHLLSGTDPALVPPSDEPDKTEK